MSAVPHAAIEQLLGKTLGRAASVVSERALGGGCIHAAVRLELSDGSMVFCKSNPRTGREIFEREAEGLRELARSRVIPVAQPIAVGQAGATAFLLIEWIPTGSRTATTWSDFGRDLAQLHHVARADRFGFAHDNHCGETPQSNRWHDEWIEFWRQERLEPQLRAAQEAGLLPRDRTIATFLDRLDRILAGADEDGPPSLIHGDLWSGNVLINEQGRAVLIDPAAYFAHREAEFGMIDWMGNFGDAFRRGYEEVWPLSPGSERRIACYRLYHELNHLNLFGGGYRSSCLSTIRSLL